MRWSEHSTWLRPIFSREYYFLSLFYCAPSPLDSDAIKSAHNKLLGLLLQVFLSTQAVSRLLVEHFHWLYHLSLSLDALSLSLSAFKCETWSCISHLASCISGTRATYPTEKIFIGSQVAFPLAKTPSTCGTTRLNGTTLREAHSATPLDTSLKWCGVTLDTLAVPLRNHETRVEFISRWVSSLTSDEDTK